MKVPRRKFLHLAAGCAMLPAATRIARAQAYPTRPVRIIAGSPAGGGIDIVGRLIAQRLSGRLGQPFVIEDRPGAATNIATEAVVRSPADGYTLLLAFSTNAINASLYDKLNFNFIRDIAPVAGIARGVIVMAVDPSLPASTIPELIAYARVNPGKLNMASGNNGGPAHVAAELFKAMAGLDMLHVPYRGDPGAVNEVLGGRVQLCFVGLPASIGLIEAGKLRALAVTTATRSPALPHLPTVGEFLPGYEASVWFGMGAPKSTSVEIIDRLNKEINAAVAAPEIKARLATLGTTALPGSPADFGKLISDETDKWGKVVKSAGIKSG